MYLKAAFSDHNVSFYQSYKKESYSGSKDIKFKSLTQMIGGITTKDIQILKMLYRGIKGIQSWGEKKSKCIS